MTERRFWKKVEIEVGNPTSCWEWIGLVRNGYGIFIEHEKEYDAIRYAYNKNKKCYLKPDEIIYHTCFNELCCRPNHMRIGTEVEREAYVLEKVSVPRDHLDLDHANEIRRLYYIGNTTYEKLGKIYGLHYKTISDIIREKSWI